MTEYHRENVPIGEILETLGIRDGVTGMNSVLCKGAYIYADVSFSDGKRQHIRLLPQHQSTTASEKQVYCFPNVQKTT